MPHHDSEPTQQQRDQAMLVHHDVLETLNRQHRDGIDYRVIMAGLGSAAADMVATYLGENAVPVWFANQAMMTKAMIDDAA